MTQQQTYKAVWPIPSDTRGNCLRRLFLCGKIDSYLRDMAWQDHLKDMIGDDDSIAAILTNRTTAMILKLMLS
jgi:hypothetical protein